MNKTLTVILTSILAFSATARDIVYKVSTYGDDANDGLTWATAKRTLQAAQAVAEYGDDIWIAKGTYYPTDGASNLSDSALHFSLKSGVRVFGGFPTTGEPTMSERNISQNQTILSGNLGDSNDTSDNSVIVLKIDDTSIDDLTVVDGITIRDANECAVKILNGGPLFRNVSIENSGGDGIMVSSSSKFYLQNCNLKNANYTNKSSGISEITGGTFTNCIITQAVNDSTLSVNGSLFINSGIKKTCDSLNTSISNSKFTQSTDKFCYYSTSKVGRVSITNCTFEKNNYAVLYSEEIATIKSSSFLENTAANLFGEFGNEGIDHSYSYSSHSGNIKITTSMRSNSIICLRNQDSIIEKCSISNNRIVLGSIKNHPEEYEKRIVDVCKKYVSDTRSYAVRFSINFSFDTSILISNGIIQDTSITNNILDAGNSPNISIYLPTRREGKGYEVDKDPIGLSSFYIGDTNFYKRYSLNFDGISPSAILYTTNKVFNCFIANNRTIKKGTALVCNIINKLSPSKSFSVAEDYSADNLTIKMSQGRSTSAGIYAVNGIIANTTIVGNYLEFTDDSPYGASAIYATATKIRNCTIVENSSKNSVYAINTSGTNNDAYKPKNCIIWNNMVSGENIYEGVDVEPINSIYGNSYRTPEKDPKLLPLGNYGGSTLSMPVASGSPAIGKATVDSEIDSDQRGYTRSTTSPTIGACEFQTSIERVNISTLENNNVFAPNTEFTLSANTDADVLEIIWTKNGVPIDANIDGTLTDSIASGTAKYVATLVYDGGVMESETFNVSTGVSTIFVKPSGNDDFDGTSWETAKRTISSALEASAYGTEIWVAKGTYDEVIHLTNGRTIVGNFEGFETAKSQRNLHSSPDNSESITTTIAAISNGINCPRVIRDAAIDGVKVLGDISAEYSAFSILNSRIEGNAKFTRNWSDKKFEIKNSKFVGDLYLSDVSPVDFEKTSENILSIDNTNIAPRFSNGYHYTMSGRVGATDFSNKGNPYFEIVNSQIGNFVSESSNNLTLDNNDDSYISGNVSIIKSDDVLLKTTRHEIEGGINVSDSKRVNIDVSKSTLTETISISNSENVTLANACSSNAVIENSKSAKIEKCILFNGSSYAVELNNSTKTQLVNCVLYNAASGGISMTASNGTILMNNTIYRNRGVGIYTADSGDTAIFNNIIWGNTKSLDVPVSIAESWTIGYSDIEGGYSNGVNIMNENPRILAVEDFDDIPIYLGLIESSPVRGKGATQNEIVSTITLPSTDLRNIERSSPTSLGAFEYISPSAVVNIEVKDGDVARGRDAVFSTNAKNVYRYYWVHSSTNEGWSWDIVSGENDSTYSRLTTSDDKFNENHYGSWLLDRNGGIKEAGYGNLNVFDLIFVKQGAMGKKDGSSWENAFTDVATAINAAMKKSRIYIAAGTYAVNDADTTNTDRKQAFALKNDLEIYGGFPAEGNPEFADRDVSKYETIFTADLLGDDEDADMDGAIDTDTMADNAYRVFFHPSSSALNETAVLDGVTIQGGYDDASEEEYKSGAGMHNNGSSPTIRNCSFVDNYSVNNGGGMYNVNAANPTIENCQFINNYAYYGGAVCDSGSSPSIKATEFSYNTAKYDGGAIRNNANSKPVIEDCDFANNSANRGAAIDAYESAPTAKRCSFSGNAATSSGGALYAYTSSNARLENCTLYNNSAYFGGGVYARENSNAQIVNCTISGNSAKYNGGALYSQNATPVIANSILWNNTAKTGNPEIYVKDSTPVINHCIVSGGYDGGVSVLTENPNLSSYGEYGGLTKSMPVDKTSSAWGAGILTLENIEIPLDDQSGSLRSTTAMTIGSMELHAAPTNLKATSGQYNDRVVLTWNASEDGKFYKVYRNTVNSPSGSIELTEDWITDLTYTDMAVEQGVNYYYFVRAAADVNGGSETWYSTSSVGYASKSTACNLTVVNGTGSGQYENGTQVAIVANAPQEGQTFDKWIGDTTYVADVNAAETILTMPAAAVTVTATYKAIEYYTLTVENGSGGGTVASGDTVQIVADTSADGMVFDKWVGDVETVADVSASTTTIKMPAKNATVTATYVEKPVIDPFGDAVVYPNVAMTILGEVDLFGSPANSGCVVAAYVGNELRGKSSIVDISGRSLVNLTVNVNANGEEIKFKIWTPSDGKIIDARADCTAVSASGDSLGSLDSPFAIVFANDLNLELLLKEGWNQVSFNVGLENMAVRTILSDVIDNVALVQGKGTSFNPSWPDSLNTLKSFDNTSGFWVKMNAAASVSLTGSALDVSAKTISLNVGWNNIGYTPATAASIRTVLATALADGKIERIINSKGNFNPATPDVLNSLKTMTPGEGYWVKANAATTIVYDKITTAKRAMRKSRAVIFATNSASENFGEPVVYPNVQMTILANVLVNGAAAPSGSVVAAFVDGELRAKQEIVSLDGKSIANLTVSVAKNGETIGFKIWNSATGETLDFATTVAAESGAAPYTYPDNLLELSASGTPSVGGDTEPAEPVVYPNTPMSLYVEVQIDGKTVSDGDIVAAYVGDELRGKQTVVIYDGKAIANLVVNVASNGEKITFKVWDASAKRLYTATTTINAEIGGEPYSYPDNLLIVNAQTATGGFALWTSKNGLSGDNANALATPFNDGITNIEKFAFGLSGNKAASYAENALFKQSYADGKACFQFPISKDAADSVNVKVMTSEDLVNWVEAQSSNIGESSDFNLMQTEQTVPEGGKLFFKLIVEEK